MQALPLYLDVAIANVQVLHLSHLLVGLPCALATRIDLRTVLSHLLLVMRNRMIFLFCVPSVFFKYCEVVHLAGTEIIRIFRLWENLILVRMVIVQVSWLVL